MKDTEYQPAIERLVEAARVFHLIALGLPLGEMLEFLERVHAIAPILDPTAYRDGMSNVAEQADLIKAARPLLKYLDELAARPKT